MANSFSARLARFVVASVLVLLAWLLYTQHLMASGSGWKERGLALLATGVSALTLLNLATLLLWPGLTGLGRVLNRFLLLLNLLVTGLALVLLLGTIGVYGLYWLPEKLVGYLGITPFLVNAYLAYRYRRASVAQLLAALVAGGPASG